MRLKKQLVVVALVGAGWGCGDTEPYLKHDLTFEKAGVCTGQEASISVTANTIGERYVVEKCLSQSFDGRYTAMRQGDTVASSFNETTGPKALFRLTIDINTWPAYRFLTVDGSTFPINIKRY